jgi:hypothetical protein
MLNNLLHFKKGKMFIQELFNIMQFFELIISQFSCSNKTSILLTMLQMGRKHGFN